MELLEQIDMTRLPKHIAIIMDGNGRWAKERGKPRLFGHNSALKAIHEVTEACSDPLRLLHRKLETPPRGGERSDAPLWKRHQA